jgi:hypothetical protein
LFEPNHYFDEGIYLTIGQNMNRGYELYRDLFDHKTPVIYWWAAATHSFFWWRVSHLVMAILSFFMFYSFTRKIFKSKVAQFVSTYLFVLLVNLPLVEGNILNGELIVLFFVLMAVNLNYKAVTNKIDVYKKELNAWSKYALLFVSGVCFGLAFITKFHGIFDYWPFFILPFFLLPKNFLKYKGELRSAISMMIVPAIGFAATLAATALFFVARGTFAYFIDNAFLYNIVYTGHGGRNNHVYIAGLIAFSGILFFLRHKLKFINCLLLIWFIATIVAAGLAGRWYPHYLLQVMPLLALLSGLLLENLIRYKFRRIVSCVLIVAMFGVYLMFYRDLGFYINRTFPYYQNWWQYVTGVKSRSNYYAWFGNLTVDNHVVAEILDQYDVQHLFIWGNNPVLYSITQTTPVKLPFVANFHLYDYAALGDNIYFTGTSTDFIFDAFERKQPEFVVEMKRLDGRTMEMKDDAILQEILIEYFRPYFNGRELILWQRK